MGGCIGTIMHADGSRGAFGHGGTQNNTKNMYKWERRAIFGNAWSWQKNKSKFGLAKKTNRDGNKHNFGRARVVKGLDMNVSKVQSHTIVKNR